MLIFKKSLLIKRKLRKYFEFLVNSWDLPIIYKTLIL